jgi:hypothetical protein
MQHGLFLLILHHSVIIFVIQVQANTSPIVVPEQMVS